MSKEKTLVAAVCPKCGANLEVDSNLEMAYCMYCRAKVIIKNDSRKVKLDKSKDLENLYTLARRAKENNNTEDALKYYEKVLIDDPNSWEPTFYTVYYKALNCKVGEIPTVILNVNNCLETVFDLIKKECKKEEMINVIEEVINHTILICTSLYESATTQLTTLSFGVNVMLMDTQKNSVEGCINTLYTLGDLLETKFKKEENIIEKAIFSWELAINLSRKSNLLLLMGKNKEEVEKIINEYADKIKKYNPEYIVPEDSSFKLGKKTQGVVDFIGYVVLGLVLLCIIIVIVAFMIN